MDGPGLPPLPCLQEQVECRGCPSPCGAGRVLRAPRSRVCLGTACTSRCRLSPRRTGPRRAARLLIGSVGCWAGRLWRGRPEPSHLGGGAPGPRKEDPGCPFYLGCQHPSSALCPGWLQAWLVFSVALSLCLLLLSVSLSLRGPSLLPLPFLPLPSHVGLLELSLQHASHFSDFTTNSFPKGVDATPAHLAHTGLASSPTPPPPLPSSPTCVPASPPAWSSSCPDCL